MTKQQNVISQLNDYIEHAHKMTDEEMRQALIFMIRVSNKQIKKSIEINEELLKQNEDLTEEIQTKQITIDMFESFIRDKGLIKEFKFYLRGFNVS